MPSQKKKKTRKDFLKLNIKVLNTLSRTKYKWRPSQKKINRGFLQLDYEEFSELSS